MSAKKEPTKPTEAEQPEHKPVENEPQKTAFFITPLGSDSSDIRRATDGLIEAVIRPVLLEHKIELIPPHQILNPGNITRQIVSKILSTDLVLANLTGLNANVMYELAIRHAVRKPIIVIAEHGTKLPFDIAAERTIFYTNDMAGVVMLKLHLSSVVPIALKDENPDNPIYSGAESLIIQDLKKTSSSAEAYILEKLDQLTSRLENVVPNQSREVSRSSGATGTFTNNLPLFLSSANLAKTYFKYKDSNPEKERVLLGDLQFGSVGDHIKSELFGIGQIVDFISVEAGRAVLCKFLDRTVPVDPGSLSIYPYNLPE